MSVKKLVLLSSMAVMLSAPAFAEKGPGGDGRHGGKLEALDTNNDGMISKDEFMDAHLKRFEKMDANADGNISMDEIKAYRDLKRAERAEKKAGDTDAEPAEPASEGEPESDQDAPTEKPAE